MTINEKVNLERLSASLQKCRIHLQRIQYAVSQTEKLFPLEREIYQNLDDAQIGSIDQLVFRFTKLQDELVTNTFRYVLVYLQEDILDKPFRDILNRLERLNIIDSSDTWLALRELRNDLAHEYPVMLEETIDKLNLLFVQLPVLENILITIERLVKQLTNIQ
ncbi:MAG: hypothetical protein K0M40_07770 [Prolixibacteraceae bacterium]|nr:hypothetical protein [Prolixibacteraceae bacterium]